MRQISNEFKFSEEFKARTKKIVFWRITMYFLIGLLFLSFTPFWAWYFSALPAAIIFLVAFLEYIDIPKIKQYQEDISIIVSQNGIGLRSITSNKTFYTDWADLAVKKKTIKNDKITELTLKEKRFLGQTYKLHYFDNFDSLCGLVTKYV